MKAQPLQIIILKLTADGTRKLLSLNFIITLSQTIRSSGCWLERGIAAKSGDIRQRNSEKKNMVINVSKPKIMVIAYSSRDHSKTY